MPDIAALQQIRAAPDLSVARDYAEYDVFAREQFPHAPDLSCYPTGIGIQQLATGPVTYTLTAAGGVLLLTGANATLTYTPVGGTGYTLTADPGALTLAVATAGMLVARVLAAAPGALTLSGSAATLTGPAVAPSTPATGGGSAKRRKRRVVIYKDRAYVVADGTEQAFLNALLRSEPVPKRLKPLAKPAKVTDEPVPAIAAELVPEYPIIRAELQQRAETDLLRMLDALVLRQLREIEDDDEEALLLLA